jgi:hypothetical protein
MSDAVEKLPSGPITPSHSSGSEISFENLIMEDEEIEPPTDTSIAAVPPDIVDHSVPFYPVGIVSICVSLSLRSRYYA